MVFEGPDGTGKTTLCDALCHALRDIGVDVLQYGFPGNIPKTLGSVVYDIHHGREEIAPPSATALQVLHVSAHLDAIERIISPAIRAGRHVVLDRFWWSTLAYGNLSAANMSVVNAAIGAERECWNGISPSLLIYVTRGTSIRDAERGNAWEQLKQQYDRIFLERGSEQPSLRVQTDIPQPPTMRIVADSVAKLLGLKRSTFIGLAESRHADSIIPLRARCEDVAAGPALFIRLSPAKPTKVYDTYWRFAAERHAVFLARLRGNTEPWTADPILRSFKFTNTFRANDRVSQFLIETVIGEDKRDWADTFFRIMVFKIFNKIETWHTLMQAFEEVSWTTYSFSHYDEVLRSAMARKQAIFSAAYIMPSGGKDSEYPNKHQVFLRLLERMIADAVPERIQDCRRMHSAFEVLRAVPLIGDFLAYQYITDLNYSHHLAFSEGEFVIPGPGAKDGIEKCFTDRGGLTEADLIRAVQDRQVEECERLAISCPSLWGRPLQLIDCQNVFCEVSKYARVAHPEVESKSGRTRIKQLFRSHGPLRTPTYPRKWGLQRMVSEWICENTKGQEPNGA